MSEIIYISAFVGLLACFSVVFDGVYRACRKFRNLCLDKSEMSDYRVWKGRAIDAALVMYKHTPRIYLFDDDKYILFSFIREYFSKKRIKSWQYAPLIYSIRTLGLDTGIPRIIQEISFNTVDDGFALYFLLKTSPELQTRYLELRKKFIKKVESLIDEQGLIRYRDCDILYVDTLPFVCPLLIYEGTSEHNDKLISLAIGELQDYYNHGVLSDAHICAHGYFSGSKLPCCAIGWGRGTGWFLLALILSYQELYGSCHREWVCGVLRTMIYAVINVQREDGAWCTRITEKTLPDSSATAIIAFVLAKYCNEIHSEQVIVDSVIKATKWLMSVTRKNGLVDMAEGECHWIGKYSRRYSISPLAQGMTLALILEIEKSSKYDCICKREE